MSKIKVSTVPFQNAVSKVIKAAGFNKWLPITSMIGIRCVNNVLSLITTDGTNSLCARADVVSCDDFNIVVDAELFAKLVSKITSECIELEITGSSLVVTGNGEYKMPLQLDDDGNTLTFPDPIDFEFGSETKVSKSVIDVMLNSIKPSLSTQAGTIYTNYYVGEVIVGTDKAMFSSFEDDSFDEHLLLSRTFVDLLGLMSDEIEMYYDEDSVLAKDGNLILYSKGKTLPDGFQENKIKAILDIEMDSYCKVNKQSLLSTLERIALFVGEFDEGAIQLHFTDSSIEIQSMASNGIESVDYMEHKSAIDFSVKININRLITQLKAYGSDSVEIYYGNDKLLKLKDGKLTQVIALML